MLPWFSAAGLPRAAVFLGGPPTENQGDIMVHTFIEKQICRPVFENTAGLGLQL